jgi:hypothetical protein
MSAPRWSRRIAALVTGLLLSVGSVSVVYAAAPVANDDIATVVHDRSVIIHVKGNDFDPDGDMVNLGAITSVSVPAHGTASAMCWNGCLIDGIGYRPDPGYVGSDTFDYEITDLAGNTDGATVVVSVTNQPPVPGRDEVQTAAGTSVQILVLQNDGDPDGDQVFRTAVQDPDHGTASLSCFNVCGIATVAYTPDPGFVGADSFEYTASDTVATTQGQITVIVGNPDLDLDGLDYTTELALGTDNNDADTDDDGYGDGAEVAAGTSPLNAADFPAVLDTDGDGLLDVREPDFGTDPQDYDTDDDGLGDGAEVDRGTAPLDADSDDDGLVDGEEVDLGTNPLDADTDDDTLTDGAEQNVHGTDPLRAHSDWDGLTDAEEIAIGTDPWVVDTDADNLSDRDEVVTFGTDPLRADTDGDGAPDGWEVNVILSDPLDRDTDDDGMEDPLDASVADPRDADTDDDGLGDAVEYLDLGTDPARADSDNDGLSDGEEVNTFDTDPLDWDSDGDGLEDGREVRLHGTDPLRADTDGDGLSDSSELDFLSPTDPLKADTDDDGLIDPVDRFLANPRDPDTDDDGYSDGVEVNELGSDPRDPNDPGQGTDPAEALAELDAEMASLGVRDFLKKGFRGAALDRIADIDTMIAAGDTDAALDELAALRTRFDGCQFRTVADKNDWIASCAIQAEIRPLIDAVVAAIED